MPILPKQQDIYPDDLLDVVEGAAGREPPVAGGRWVAFYTLSRREKDLMRKLQAAGVPFYGPMVRRRLHSAGGRVRSSYVPLFPEPFRLPRFSFFRGLCDTPAYVQPKLSQRMRIM